MRKFVAGSLGFRSCRGGSRLRHRMGLVTSLGALILLASASGSAQTLSTVFTFSGTYSQYCGTSTQYLGTLTVSGSTLYGTSEYAGSSGCGTVFEVGTDGTGFQTLLTFTGTNGEYPLDTLALCGSTLYGTTHIGGVSGDGTVFSIGVDGTGYQKLLDFNGSNGAHPGNLLTISGSTLYGTTSGGVFRIGTNGGRIPNLALIQRDQQQHPLWLFDNQRIDFLRDNDVWQHRRRRDYLSYRQQWDRIPKVVLVRW